MPPSSLSPPDPSIRQLRHHLAARPSYEQSLAAARSGSYDGRHTSSMAEAALRAGERIRKARGASDVALRPASRRNRQCAAASLRHRAPPADGPPKGGRIYYLPLPDDALWLALDESSSKRSGIGTTGSTTTRTRGRCASTVKEADEVLTVGGEGDRLREGLAPATRPQADRKARPSGSLSDPRLGRSCSGEAVSGPADD